MAVKTASEMTYIVSSGALTSTPTNQPSQRDWRRGAVVSGVRRMNEANPRRTRLVLGWVTVCA